MSSAFKILTFNANRNHINDLFEKSMQTNSVIHISITIICWQSWTELGGGASELDGGTSELGGGASGLGAGHLG